jgi:ABC-type transport system involved in multi-copper enzyme maturation permease subunit
MIRVLAIAKNTFRESIRDRVLYSLLFFGLIVIVASVVTQEVTIGDSDKVVRSVGLGSIRLFGSVFAIFLGIGLVYKELERKTIYTIASKPIARWMFIVGKYLGLMGVMAVMVLAMGTIYSVVLAVQQGFPSGEVFVSLGLMYVELGLLTAWALLFSSYSSPIVASLFSGSILVIGNLADDVKLFGGQADSESVRQLSEVVYWLLPNFSVLNVTDLAVHGLPIEPARVGWSIAYGLGYIVAVLAASTLVFERRDFK